ncbi:MAG TPA: STAS domain-containing protein, partial [Streptosporangiaceae bacterium]|nr:STAS domain-containing protein [Streptosporangiaceae bacterium]
MTSACVATTRALPGAAVIELSGEVDGSAAAILTEAYERAVTAGPENPDTVVLDFAAVDYINSTGIALIVSVLARARAERRKVVASGLSPHYREIFDITRLSDFIELFPDLDHAVSQLTGPAALRGAQLPTGSLGRNIMSAPAITMDVRRIGDEVAVVDIKGEVTAACEPVLMSAYEAAGGGSTARLVLNFAGLEYMNSGGIG